MTIGKNLIRLAEFWLEFCSHCDSFLMIKSWQEFGQISIILVGILLTLRDLWPKLYSHCDPFHMTNSRWPSQIDKNLSWSAEFWLEFCSHSLCTYVMCHCWFLEPWNREKSLTLIWQRFSCLLDEWIAKISKIFFFHGGFLR